MDEDDEEDDGNRICCEDRLDELEWLDELVDDLPLASVLDDELEDVPALTTEELELEVLLEELEMDEVDDPDEDELPLDDEVWGNDDIDDGLVDEELLEELLAADPTDPPTSTLSILQMPESCGAPEAYILTSRGTVV